MAHFFKLCNKAQPCDISIWMDNRGDDEHLERLAGFNHTLSRGPGDEFTIALLGLRKWKSMLGPALDRRTIQVSRLKKGRSGNSHPCLSI